MQKVRDIVSFLSDKKILLGIGIGLFLGGILMLSYGYNNALSQEKIEEKAREYGMHYEDECKAFFGKDEE